MTTFSSPALIIIRRHMEQEVASGRMAPVAASFPARYRVPPTMSRRAAEMMALASAWTLRHSSYRSPRGTRMASRAQRSEEHTSELQSRFDLVCRLLLEKKNVEQYIQRLSWWTFSS